MVYDYYYYHILNLQMLDSNYIVFHDILPKFNEHPCVHYDDILYRLSQTCKLFNKIYAPKQIYCLNWGMCDICEYREISCEQCIKNYTKKCEVCTCKKCNLSTNLMDNKWLIDGECRKCRGHSFGWVRNIGGNLID